MKSLSALTLILVLAACAKDETTKIGSTVQRIDPAPPYRSCSDTETAAFYALQSAASRGNSPESISAMQSACKLGKFKTMDSNCVYDSVKTSTGTDYKYIVATKANEICANIENL